MLVNSSRRRWLASLTWLVVVVDFDRHRLNGANLEHPRDFETGTEVMSALNLTGEGGREREKEDGEEE